MELSLTAEGINPRKKKGSMARKVIKTMVSADEAFHVSAMHHSPKPDALHKLMNAHNDPCCIDMSTHSNSFGRSCWATNCHSATLRSRTPSSAWTTTIAD